MAKNDFSTAQPDPQALDNATMLRQKLQDAARVREIQGEHSDRQKVLDTIKKADEAGVQEVQRLIDALIDSDKLGLMSRIPDDPLRSYKNISIGHNTLFAYIAETGGMDSAISHYLSERFAILIEFAYSFATLRHLNHTMIETYCDHRYRVEYLRTNTLQERIAMDIHIHLNEPIQVKDIAKRLYLSPEHLMRRYKQLTGQTVHCLIMDIKNKEAKELLETTSLTIQAIAQRLGEPNATEFSRKFKRLNQVTPSAYRRQAREV